MANLFRASAEVRSHNLRMNRTKVSNGESEMTRGSSRPSDYDLGPLGATRGRTPGSPQPSPNWYERLQMISLPGGTSALLVPFDLARQQAGTDSGALFNAPYIK